MFAAFEVEQARTTLNHNLLDDDGCNHRHLKTIPDRCAFLGYAGWSAGQLEAEMKVPGLSRSQNVSVKTGSFSTLVRHRITRTRAVVQNARSPRGRSITELVTGESESRFNIVTVTRKNRVIIF